MSAWARRRVGVVLWSLAALSASEVLATHDEPGKGGAAKAALVTVYEPCAPGSANTTTAGLTPVPACSPPVRVDTVCGFGSLAVSRGTGRVKVKARNFDLDITVAVKGLENSCNGMKLCFASSIRMTTDRCVDSPCTVIDLVDIPPPGPTSCCIVSGGTCSIRTSINNAIFDALRAHERAGIEILGCGLRRVDGPSVPTGLSFACGLLAP
jgi:hypothetical protein